MNNRNTNIRKYSTNFSDGEMGRYYINLDPLSYPIKDEFNLTIIDDSQISLLGVPIMIKSIINSEAKAEEIVNGFNLLISNKLGLHPIDKERLLTCISKSEGQDRCISCKVNELPKEINLREALVGLLRLSYYYYKCNNAIGFHFKAKEIKTKISSSLKNIDLENFEGNMDILAKVIKDTGSELMFATMALKAETELSFDKENEFKIKNIPCEVKTIHDKYFAYLNKDGDIEFGSAKEEFGNISFSKELIVQILREKWKNHLKKAIEQKGRLIFFNTYSTVLHDLNIICNCEKCLTFEEILSYSINLTKKDFLPLITCSSIISSLFDQKFFLALIPIKGKFGQYEIDENRFKSYELTKNILFLRKDI